MIEASRAHVEPVDAFVGRHPHAAFRVFDERFDAIVRERRGILRVVPVARERIGRRIEMRDSAAERPRPHTAVARRKE